MLIFCALGSKTNAFAIPYDILTQSTLEAGEAEIRNRVSGNGFVAKETQNEIEGNVVINGTCEANSYKVSGLQVVGSRGVAITDATNLATAISQLNLLLAAVRTHGLIAT